MREQAARPRTARELALICIVLCFPISACSTDEPFWEIVIYSQTDGFAGNLSQIVTDLLGDEQSQQVSISVVEASDVSSFIYDPGLICIVLASDKMMGFSAIEEDLMRYFSDGGGVVGFHFPGKIEVDPILATAVFPLSANVTALKRGGKNGYVKADREHAIAYGLPDEFLLKDGRMAFSANESSSGHAWAGTRPEAGDADIVFIDDVYGAPLLMAYENQGRSVIFSGCEVRTDSYADFIQDENFQMLLVNSVRWVSEAGISRSETLHKVVVGRSATIALGREQILEQGEIVMRRYVLGRLLLSAILISVGLVTVGMVKRWCFPRSLVP